MTLQIALSIAAVLAGLLSSTIALISAIKQNRDSAQRKIEFAQRQLEFQHQKEEAERQRQENWRDILISRIIDKDWGLDARKIAYKEYIDLGYNGSLAAKYGKELA